MLLVTINMNIILFLSYALVLFVYYYSPQVTAVLNINFKELINRSLGALFAAVGLFLQQKDTLFSIEKMYTFYVVILLALAFILLISFVGNKINYSDILNINRYDVITCLLYFVIISCSFLYYMEFYIYFLSPNYLFSLNIIFCLWVVAVMYLAR